MIDENANDENSLKEIQNWIEQNGNNEYNLKIEYNEENGLVQKIDLQIVQKNQ